MVDETRICFLKASIWVKILACIQTLENSLLLFIAIVGFANVAAHDFEDEEIKNKNLALALLGVKTTIELIGMFMGILLFWGSNEKNVGCLRAWLIYGIPAFFITVIRVILLARFSSQKYIVIATAVGGPFVIAIHAFCLVVVFIHEKEINEGIFTPYRWHLEYEDATFGKSNIIFILSLLIFRAISAVVTNFLSETIEEEKEEII